MTPKGYRKRPSYKAIVDMVENAVSAISKEMIKWAFECCGIAECGGVVPLEKLNQWFKTVISWKDSAGLIEAGQLSSDDEDEGVGAGSVDDEVVERRPGDEISDNEYSDEFE
uniref:Uncharacterized protein n=1 Tax=Plectus sambesii TaxID=2011161 RepID=A0A914WZ58_9BILA